MKIKKCAILAVTLFIMCIISIGCVKSDGERSGKLVKFSKSGLIIKSHEGVLQLGETAESNWYFSIKDEDTDMIKFCKENVGKEISAKYNERVLEIGNIGYDTRYYIRSAKVIE